ncbi:MAG: hypothetical protein N3B21_18875 [Clostridia bacterium]|nr:hypothetical protein [Clostridia bacterium]
MGSGDTRRIVVIKDIPSNIIEEAILILKGDPGAKNDGAAKDVPGRPKKRDNDYLIKEAEMVINNYIKSNKTLEKEKVSKSAVVNTSTPKKKFFVNTAINCALMGSIALLILLLTKVI